ncbi:MAG: hypothetical protein Q9P14_04730 [candidate division KSB1 bacterium]|nr:hypothetical protein [candidate division KSB1 bacterium]
MTGIKGEEIAVRRWVDRRYHLAAARDSGLTANAIFQGLQRTDLMKVHRYKNILKHFCKKLLTSCHSLSILQLHAVQLPSEIQRRNAFLSNRLHARGMALADVERNLALIRIINEGLSTSADNLAIEETVFRSDDL